MELAALKPVVSGLVMPLASLLLVIIAGLAFAITHKRAGLVLALLASSALWLLSCQGAAVWLATHALPQYPAITPAQLKASNVQAIVVLGGGIYPQAP
jgi:uncharacterized SAM-binding protein YcdF (DUF218 family)